MAWYLLGYAYEQLHFYLYLYRAKNNFTLLPPYRH